MKNGFFDRLLVYLYVLLTLIIIAVMALQAFGVDLFGAFIDGLRSNAPGLLWRLILIGVCAVIALRGVYVAVVITPSRKKKNGFITITSDDGGQVRISLPAIREMCRQAISGVEGLKDVNINVAESQETLAMNVSMDVESGVHVPSVTAAMKSAIKRNIEMSCGIGVSSVVVDVKNVLPGKEPPLGAINYPAKAEPAPAQPAAQPEIEIERETVESIVYEDIAAEESAVEANEQPEDQEIALTLEAPAEEEQGEVEA